MDFRQDDALKHMWVDSSNYLPTGLERVSRWFLETSPDSITVGLAEGVGLLAGILGTPVRRQ